MTQGMRTLCCTLAAGLLFAGCMPFAIPPLRAGGGGGVTVGRIVAEKDGPLEEAQTQGGYHVRVDVMPLDVVPSLVFRDFDLGVGYVLEGLDADRPSGSMKHGASISGTYYPLILGEPGPKSKGWVWRLGLTARGELLYGRTGRGWDQGFGSTIGLSWGGATFSDGGFADPGMAGYAYGEAGVETYVEASWRTLQGGEYYLINVGMLFRLPLTAGVVSWR